MDWLKANKAPLATSITVFAALSSGVVLLAKYYDFSQVDLEALLFVLALLCSIFIAKNVFDSVKVENITKKLNKSFALDLAISSEELYIQLYENSPVPYCIIDFDGKITSANIAAVRMLGVRQNQVKGLNIFDHIRCEDESHLDLLVRKYHNGASVSSEMVEVRRPDKFQTWALLSLFKFNNFGGEHIGLVAMVDITKQKKAEDAKSEFVSLASHQLRTPIAGMKWSAELLLMDNPENLSDRQKKYIDRLLVSVRRMAILVDDFLRVSRFELGNFTPEYVQVDLIETFEDVMSQLTSRVSQKNISVKTYYDESIKDIITDANLIRIIITNLYSNATKYTRVDGTIHAGFARKGDDIAITIADNGMGIPIEDQDEIFSKLFRASNAVREVPNGTGLGLYIVHEAVSVLKGNINFTTAENVGATFEVVLPLVLAEDN